MNSGHQASRPVDIGVGIVVPAYNAASYLFDTLQSIVDQDFPSFECVVVDDGSTDGTLDIARTFASSDRRFTVISQQNAGVGAARNHGASVLKTKPRYISFMDADDVWLDDALSRLVRAAESGPFIGAHGLGEIMDSEGNRVRVGEFEELGRSRVSCGRGWPRPWPSSAPTCFQTVLVRSTMFPPGLMITLTDLYERIGGFDNRIRPADDWDFLIRLTRRGDIAFLGEVILRYRRHQSNAGAGLQVPELCRQVRVKNYYSPENTATQRRTVRRAFRASQVLDFCETSRRVGQAMWTGDARGVAVNLLRLPLRVVRFIAGFPRRRPVDHELAIGRVPSRM